MKNQEELICSLNSNDVIHIQEHFSHRLIDAG
jgi:hypothetical protein